MSSRRKPSAQPAIARYLTVEGAAAEAFIAEVRAILAGLRVTVSETQLLVDANKSTLEHAVASIKQIASIESSIIRVFKPMQETVDLHSREIGSIKARLDRVEIAVKALDPGWAETPT